MKVTHNNGMSQQDTSSESIAILNALESHIFTLHIRWKTLLDLFGSGDDTVKLLHETAGAFFNTVYSILLQDILLGIARLTDPLKTKGKENLVLKRIAQLPEVAADSSLLTASNEVLQEIKLLTEPFRDYRNQYIAHLDLPKSLGPSTELLPGIKTHDIDAVLEAFARLLNLVNGSLRGQRVQFKNVMVHGGAKSIIRACKLARA